MRTVVVMALLGVAAVSADQKSQTQTFTGVITDEMCPTGDHSKMRMGNTAADCTRACVAAHGSRYVLYDGKRAYILSDQKAPAPLAAQKVGVTGTLDTATMTIRVESMAAAK